jgi:hypothetical protein
MRAGALAPARQQRNPGSQARDQSVDERLFFSRKRGQFAPSQHFIRAGRTHLHIAVVVLIRLVAPADIGDPGQHRRRRWIRQNLGACSRVAKKESRETSVVARDIFRRRA